MISRGAPHTNNADLSSDALHMQQQHVTQTEINLMDNDHQGIHADMSRMQTPIFNIHIHVPPYQGGSSKMYLPRIQPVIHLHFDELATKLEINREPQNQEATYEAFQKLLSMALPKFGNVQFHYQDKMNETIRKEKEFSGTVPCSSVNYSNDMEAHAGAASERLGNRVSYNCGMPDCCGSQNSNEDNSDSDENNISDSESNSEEKLKRKYNLKEAVVVLEDVCKTEYYKNMVAARYIRDSTEHNEFEYDDLLRRVDNSGGQEVTPTNSLEYGNFHIKTEIESCSPESVSPTRGRSIGENINVNPLNPSNQMLHKLGVTSPSARNRSDSDVSVSSERTLNALAQGCKFSDILSRFQARHNDSLKYYGDTKQSSLLCDHKERCNYESNERFPQPSASCSGPSVGETSFEDRDSINRTVTHIYRSRPNFGNFRESVMEMNTPNWRPSTYREISSDDTARSPSNELDSDDMAWTSEEEAKSNSLLEIVSPNWRGNVLMPNISATNGDRFVNLVRSGFQLDIYEEEMGRRTGRNLKKKAPEAQSSSSKESAPPKRMKRSDDGKKKSQPTPRMEEYIPLQASGPTKFAVAPLNKVNPYRAHDARNFKKDMLFGNRINRFSSPDHLRIYQLKQKAAKTQSN